MVLGNFYNDAPVLSGLADTNITTDQNLELKFSEPVTAITGDIIVCDSANKVVATVPVTDKAVTGSGSSLITVDLPNDLAAGEYCVKVDVGAFQDADLRDYTSTDVINFTVSAAGTGGETGTGETNDVSLDTLGSATDPVTLDETGAFNFTDNAADAKGNNVIITEFGADDSITITGATAEQYDDGVIGSNEAGDVSITFNNDGILHQITLTGVAAGAGLVFDVNSFNALPVGDLIFS
ncbi:hypothetical protein CKO12_11600 [Chromatium okenii]|nr:hypothetical protein [Chromatium okenii]